MEDCDATHSTYMAQGIRNKYKGRFATQYICYMYNTGNKFLETTRYDICYMFKTRISTHHSYILSQKLRNVTVKPAY